MEQVLDLHIHSKYSRACSPKLTLPNIEAACKIKGVDIIATGDFTHPAWFRDIKTELEESGKETGLYVLRESARVHPVKSSAIADAGRAGFNRVKFILSTEVALIYKDGGKARRIHLVLHAPNIEAAQELNGFLGKKYNIKSDGRPILGMKSADLIKLCLSINPQFLIYPAHLWTPWFSVFGSKSGFNSFEECFHEQTQNIYAYETGLSSDPEMNWRLSALDGLMLLSNSDAHSLANIAREANVIELSEITYDQIYRILKEGQKEKMLYTIEFYPEEGMYHFDGHRECKVRLSPEETKKHKGICPVCKRPMTIGVLNRVDELADREIGFEPKSAPAYKKLVELDKIIAESLNVKSRNGMAVQKEYARLINIFKNELNILLRASLESLQAETSVKIVEGIRRVRDGNLIIDPGYDGQYGTVKIFTEKEKSVQEKLKLI